MKKKVTIKETIEESRNKKADEGFHPVWKENQGSKVPRTFRWTLRSPDYPEIHWWAKEIVTDYKNRCIDVSIYDDKDGHVFNWIQSILKEGDKKELKLFHLDADEKPMYVLTFKELEIIDHKTNYDYSSSKVLTNRIIISFKKIERKNNLDIN